MRIGLAVTLSLLLFGCITGYAQEDAELQYPRLTKFPLASVNYYNFSSSDYRVGSQTATNLDQDFLNAMIQIVFPLQEKQLYLFNGLEYGYARYRLITRAGDRSSRAFHSIKYNLGLIKVLANRKTLAINVIPVFSSDFNKMTGNALIYNAAALMMKRKSPNFEYGFGVAFTSYVSRFESPLVVPLISMTYVDGKHTTKMVLPSFISQRYALNERTDLMLEFKVMGALYDMVYTNPSTAYDLNGFSETKFLLGPKVRYRVTGDFYLNMEGGLVFGNQVIIQDDQRKSELEIQSDERFYLKLGLAVLK